MCKCLFRTQLPKRVKSITAIFFKNPINDFVHSNNYNYLFDRKSFTLLIETKTDVLKLREMFLTHFHFKSLTYKQVSINY